ISGRLDATPEPQDAGPVGGERGSYSALRPCFSNAALPQTTQDVTSDLLDVWFAACQHAGPVRGRGIEDNPIVDINPHRSGATARKIIGILGPFGPDLAGSEDHKILGRPVAVTGDEKTAFVRPVGNRCAVALVTDERVIRAENIAVAQAGTL